MLSFILYFTNMLAALSVLEIFVFICLLAPYVLALLAELCGRVLAVRYCIAKPDLWVHSLDLVDGLGGVEV